MHVKRNTWLIVMVTLILGIVGLGLYAYYPSTKRVPCDSLLPGSTGKYIHLARVEDSYVYPIGNVVIEPEASWRIDLDYFGSVLTSTDLSDVKRFQRLRFACTGGDSGTAEIFINIYRNGKLLYSTGVFGEGLQNSEVGYAEAYNRLAFYSFLVFFK